MITDPIADLLTRIRNAQSARKDMLTAPYSNVKHRILETLKKNGFIKDVKKVDGEKFPELEITLDLQRPKVTFTRVSTPGQRIYKSKNDLKVIKNGLGIEVLSTSKGIMTNAEAFTQNLGGEVICKVY
jgi:small subunit ribosomal protein S8